MIAEYEVRRSSSMFNHWNGAISIYIFYLFFFLIKYKILKYIDVLVLLCNKFLVIFPHFDNFNAY